MVSIYASNEIELEQIESIIQAGHARDLINLITNKNTGQPTYKLRNK